LQGLGGNYRRLAERLKEYHIKKRTTIVQPRYQLRNTPKTLSGKDVIDMLKKHNFFCKKYSWTENYFNESGNFENDFADSGDGTITDRAIGLMWQKSGSDNYMTYNKAEAYIRKLNDEKFAGYRDWRIPTLEELASLFKNKGIENNLYINPIFDKKKWWCWSADRRGSGGWWIVNFHDGLIDWYVLYDNLVRGVRP